MICYPGCDCDKSMESAELRERAPGDRLDIAQITRDMRDAMPWYTLADAHLPDRCAKCSGVKVPGADSRPEQPEAGYVPLDEDTIDAAKRTMEDIEAHLKEWPCAGGIAAIRRLDWLLGGLAFPAKSDGDAGAVRPEEPPEQDQ